MSVTDPKFGDNKITMVSLRKLLFYVLLFFSTCKICVYMCLCWSAEVIDCDMDQHTQL